MDEPETWRWIWLGVAVLFGIGEMATPGAFFLAPFAAGAVVASALAFADVALSVEWFAFLGVSIGAFVAMRPLARKLDRHGASDGVGSRRLIGRKGIVIEPIGTAESGLVRIDREEWRAEASDRSAIATGTTVLVTEVEGTRVIVTPSKEHAT